MGSDKKTGAGHNEIGAPEAGIEALEVHVLTPLYEDLYAGIWTGGHGPHVRANIIFHRLDVKGNRFAPE